MDSISAQKGQSTRALHRDVASSRYRENAFSRREGAQVGKPSGGFVFIPASELIRAWDCYQRGVIALRDLRVWFAAHEQLARRTAAQLDDERLPHFTEQELQRLVGGKAVKASLRRLEGSRLLAWTKSSLRFANAAKARLGAESGLLARLSLVKNQARLVPVPRCWIRLLAQTGTSAVIAVLLGLMLQGLYYRDGQCVAWGRAKSSWMACLFGLDVRNIKRARRHLLTLGLMLDAPDDRWKRQRWGGAFTLNLAWSRPDSYSTARPSSPPPTAEIRPDSPPPVSDRNLPSEINNQKLGSAGPAGICVEKGIGEEQKPPTWKHVERGDLSDTARLLSLFEQAARKGDVSGSEHGRLLFVTAAEHASCRGTRNAPGLFVHLVKRKLWHYCTQDDEEAARARIKRELFDVRREREKPRRTPKPTVVELTHEQKLAKAIERVCEQRKLTPMLVIRSMKLDWTLERYHVLQQQAEDVRLDAVAARVRPADVD